MMKYLIGLLAVIFMLGTFNIKIIPAQAGAVELSTPRAAVQLTPEELLDTSVKFEEDVLMIDIAGSIIDKKWMGSGVIIGDGTRVLLDAGTRDGVIFGMKFLAQDIDTKSTHICTVIEASLSRSICFFNVKKFEQTPQTVVFVVSQ